MRFFITPPLFIFLIASTVGICGVSKVELFHQWDRNQDNLLVRSELPRSIQKNFSRVDVNRDKTISLKEHLQFLSKKTKDSKNKNNSETDNRTILLDIPYASSKNPRQKLDLILPKNRDTKKTIPLVVWIHGGGWKNGDKKTGHSPNRIPALIKTDRYAGATIGYRLSGEAIWPAQIHDCKAAIRWLRANAAKFGYDPNRIAVWGSSAGGHLVSMLGTTGDNKELEGNVGNHLDQSSHVQAVVNYYGPSALLQMNDHPSKIDHNAPHSPESQLLGSPIQDSKSKAKQASPLHHVTAEDAPFIHFHGTDDPLVPFHQSKLLHQAIKEKGVPSTLITLQGGGHSMPGTFTQSKVIPFLDSILYKKGILPTDQTVKLR